MMTYTEAAQTPAMRAAYDAMDPEAQAFVGRMNTWLDAMDDDTRKLAELGIDILLHVAEQAPAADPQRLIAATADQALAATPPDDNETIVTLDDGQTSGVAVERHDDREGPSWLNFAAGDLELSIDFDTDHEIDGGPVGISINNQECDGPWTMETLRALHRDLGRILASPLLPGALTEAWGFYTGATGEQP